MYVVGSFDSGRPLRFHAVCRHYWFTQIPLIGALFLEFQFCLTPVTVTNLCGSASKCVFGQDSWEIVCPDPGWIAPLWDFVFCDCVHATI